MGNIFLRAIISGDSWIILGIAKCIAQKQAVSIFPRGAAFGGHESVEVLFTVDACA